MNVTNIEIHVLTLRRCVELVHNFNPDFIPDGDVETVVNAVVERTKDHVSSVRHKPFALGQVSVGPCIQVTLVQPFDDLSRTYKKDTVSCVFTVQPIDLNDNTPTTTFPI